MKRTYRCPHCTATLNPNVKIILRAENAGKRGLLLFSPKPGSYDVLVPEGFPLKKKDVVRFSCPACGEDLTSKRAGEMAEILFITADGDQGTVAFSRVYGKHATLFITSEKVLSYGEDVDSGLNFWGVGRDD